MNPIESFLKLISSPAFAESIFSGVAGNAAYDAVKPTIEKITRQLTGKPASEDELRAALEDLMIQIGAHTNLNINQLRAEILAAIGQKSPGIPRQLTRYFPISADECIGRDEDLKKLAEALRRSPKVVVVNGLGGIGKTTLAKVWLQSALAEYDHFLWIEMAGNDDRRDQRVPNFLETVAYHPELADNLRLSFGEKEPPENRFHHIMNALRQLDGRNLLVVDNAGPDLEQKEIREQLPLPPAWQVLVTSRSKLNGYQLVPLDRLSPENAKALFLLHFTGDCPDDMFDELLREVDYHTLTVELLAKTLENHLGSLTISDLLAKLRRRELADPELQRRISLHHSTEETEVYLHLLATFDCAGLDEEERLLLARFAALPPSADYSAAQLEEWGFALPLDKQRSDDFESLDREVGTSSDDSKSSDEYKSASRRALHETLLRLDRKGWLTRSAQNTFSLHRMIQQAALYQLQPTLAELGVLVEAFYQKIRFDTSTNFTLLFQWIPYAEQVLATLPENEQSHEDLSGLMNNCGIVYLELGQYERARDLLEAALASDLKNFGAEHPTVAVRQSNLAEVYRNLGQYEKSRGLLEAALSSDLKNFSPEHQTVAVRRSNLGLVYGNLGQYERARDLLEAALASDLKNFGAEHPTVAVRQSNLANVYRNLGQYERARDLLEAALASDLKNFGAEHPSIAIRQSNLANVYSDLGQYERARDLLEAALASNLKNFGAEHPNVAVSQSNLANVYSNLGQYERARDLLEAALASAEKNFGAEHPTVAVRQINLGAVFLQTGEKEKAKVLFQQAYNLFKKHLGEQHPNTQTAKRWLEE